MSFEVNSVSLSLNKTDEISSNPRHCTFFVLKRPVKLGGSLINLGLVETQWAVHRAEIPCLL
jgi:hypothetical protein